MTISKLGIEINDNKKDNKATFFLSFSENKYTEQEIDKIDIFNKNKKNSKLLDGILKLKIKYINKFINKIMIK